MILPQGTRTSSPSLDDLLSAYERVVIMETLRRNGWNRRKAAEALKISPRRFYGRLAVLRFELAAIPHDRRGRRLKVAEGAA
jgi:DNA-binding NtrC family response regulator